MKNLTILLFAITVLLSACGSDDPYVPVVETDTENPTAPANLMASNVLNTSMQLDWEAATDNIAVVGYTLFQDGVVIINNIEATSTLVDGLDPDVSYDFYVTAIDAENNESNASNTLSVTTALEPLTFLPSLTQMGVFTGTLSNLEPETNVQLYELTSTLFTDYAAKQRLVKLPEGTSMEYKGDDLLPNFPDNTLIAKTFYYNVDDRDPDLGKQIIETRIFLKVFGTWEVGDYIWNDEQTEATYRETGSVKPISYIDLDGNTKNVSYLIPSKQDCFTCHNNNGTTFPIGMKLRNMNFDPQNGTVNENQIDYFIANDLLTGITSSAGISVLPDWTDDVTYDIFERGRAYIDINCAHCHQPGGEVTNFNLDFRYETPFDDTGIYANRGEIESRTQSNVPTFRMPQLGRTVVHEEAVQMLLLYLEAIEE